MKPALKPTLKLGLIGTSIQKSRMSMLQRLAGERTGQAVTYDLFDLERNDPVLFEQTFERCKADGFHGINVTHPFKELAAARVRIDDPLVRAIGAVNTVIFDDGVPRGFNTDYTGFLHAWRGRFGEGAPGAVAVIGTGGVGRAIVFGLAALDAPEIRLFDVDAMKAQSLADAVRSVNPGSNIVIAESCETAAAGADGLVNATPVGMHHHLGCPVPEACLKGQRWVFDAIYTPMETELLHQAAARGIDTLSGFKLFIGQGMDGFEIFTGVRLSDDDVAAIEGAIQATL